MREIKFRVWDIKNNRWYGNTIWEDGMQFDSGLELSCDPEKYSIMQFTGLKDKNGKEIYEGDILECHEYDSSDTGRRIIQTFKNAVVGFHQGCYWYYPKGNMTQPHQLLMHAFKPTVIGNIYQNHELLKL